MKFLRTCYLFILPIYIFPAVVCSQTLHATVRGQILDTTGHALEGALLSAVHEATLDRYQALSGTGGEYTFSILPPGTYRFEVEMDGFRKGTDSLLLAIAMSKASVKVLGGGHLGSLAAEMGISKNVHVSTGGGVLLALLGGEELPAISLLLRGRAVQGKSRGGR